MHCRTSAGRSSLKQPCSTQPCMVTESKGPLISSKLWPHRSTNNGQVGPWNCKPLFWREMFGLGRLGGFYFSGRQWWHRFILGMDDLFLWGGDVLAMMVQKLELMDCETWKCKSFITLVTEYDWTPSQYATSSFSQAYIQKDLEGVHLTRIHQPGLPNWLFFLECQVCLEKQHDRYKMGPYPGMCGVITL